MCVRPLIVCRGGRKLTESGRDVTQGYKIVYMPESYSQVTSSITSPGWTSPPDTTNEVGFTDLDMQAALSLDLHVLGVHAPRPSFRKF